jgi:hypothetical protein
MKLSAELIAKLEPLTRNPAAFTALRDAVDAMVAEKSEKHIAAAKAALVDLAARPAGLIALGAYAQAQEVQNLLLQISGKQNKTEEK